MLPYTTYSISISRFSVDIRTTVDLIAKYQSFLAAKTPPHFDCDPFALGSGYQVYHEESDKNIVSLDDEQKVIVAECSSSSLRGGDVLFYIAQMLLEAQMQQSGFLTCHGACVSLKGNGILLLGTQGAGKTSIAIKLCREYGAQLISNNFCVLGLRDNQPIIERGTCYFFLRYASVRQNLPFLTPLFLNTTQDPWTHKVSIFPNEIDIKVNTDPTPITCSYLLHVDNGQETLHEGPANNMMTKLYLYENFSRYIRGTGLTILMGSTYDFASYLPSLDCKAFFDGRVRLINTLLQDLAMSHVSGSIDDVTRWIATDSAKVIAAG